ncbi:hypothetical protein [Paenibacillus sp. HB172176]|uniref:hypothetical protein n=1 Tax=Paenibacillus sp. HB172176 TaxID=2493690 RepID=UPI00143C7697|nr:hypothetical protein [Paenibacillus sp. HB172176]
MKYHMRKTNPTKLLLTATICASIMFGASACNNNNNTNLNNNENAGTNGAMNAPMATDGTVLPSEGAQ